MTAEMITALKASIESLVTVCDEHNTITTVVAEVEKLVATG